MDITLHPDGSISIGMGEYLRDIIDIFPEEILGPDSSAAYKNLDHIRDDAENSDEEKSDLFNYIIAKLL